MIEFECTFPYIKVSACRVNTPCKHFYHHAFLKHLQRLRVILIRAVVHSQRSHAHVALCVFLVSEWEECTHRGRTNCRTRRRERKKGNRAKCQKEDASGCQFECSEPCWAEPTNFELRRCTCQLVPVQGLLWRQQQPQIKMLFERSLVSWRSWDLKE